METERIALNQRERERLKVLYEVKQKHLTQVEAAQRLKVTDRQVRRLLLALAERAWRDGSRVAGSGIESQAADLVRAEDSDPGTEAVCGLWADPGRGAKKRFLEFWPFRNPPTSNSR